MTRLSELLGGMLIVAEKRENQKLSDRLTFKEIVPATRIESFELKQKNIAKFLFLILIKQCFMGDFRVVVIYLKRAQTEA